MAKEKSAAEKFVDDVFPHFDEFLREFEHESDRAAVILGAAKLDYLLYQILYKFLLPNVGSNDELLAGDSPLSTFSAKTHMAYRLGIIDSEFARALHLTRRIRNAFAHETSGCKLETGPHRDRVRELIAPFTKFPTFHSSKKIFFSNKSGAAADFFTALAIMVLRLEAIFSKITTVNEWYDRALFPPAYYEEMEAKKQKAASKKVTTKSKVRNEDSNNNGK